MTPSQEISTPEARFVEVDAVYDLQAIRRDARLLEPLSHGALEDTLATKATLGEARATDPFLAQADVRLEVAFNLTEGDDTSDLRRPARVSASALNGWRVWPLAKDLSTGLLQRQCCGAFSCWWRWGEACGR